MCVVVGDLKHNVTVENHCLLLNVFIPGTMISNFIILIKSNKPQV